MIFYNVINTTCVQKNTLFCFFFTFIILINFTVSTQAKTLVSKNTTRMAGNFQSYSGDISADGKYIVYASSSSDLVRNDTNSLPDVFLYHVDSGQTERLSVPYNAAKVSNANGESSIPSISADGEFVAFVSTASNLTVGDKNNTADIFVYQRSTATVKRISRFKYQGEYSATPTQVDISDDGRFVVFDTVVNNFVDDNNQASDIFLYDRETELTEKISNTDELNETNGNSYHAVISGNGRFVAFESQASNLVAGDHNQLSDVFVYDRESGNTHRVSVNSDDIEANGESLRPQISADGQFISFYSSANNLIESESLNKSHTEASDGIYLHDRVSGKTQLVSLAEDKKWPDHPVNPDFDMSSDASFIVFSSRAQNITEYWPGLCENSSNTSDCYWGATNNIFRYSRLSNHIELISIDDTGFPLDTNNVEPSISGNGELMVFSSLGGDDVDMPANSINKQLYLSRPPKLKPITLIAPGGDIFEDFPIYTWGAHNKAVAYRIAMSGHETQAWIPISDVDCSDTVICSTTPLAMLDYGANSIAIQYATGLGSVSPLSSPVIAYKRPGTPQPEALVAVSNKAPTLRWNAIPDAIDYRVKVMNRTTGEFVLNHRIKNATSTSYTLPEALNPEHTYIWIVKVQKPNGLYSRWAPVTHQIAPSIPEPTYPKDSVGNMTPTFQWQAEPNVSANTYNIIIEDLNTQVIIDKTINNNLSYTHNTAFTLGHRYRWKVRAQSPGGEYSQWSYFTLSDAGTSTEPKNSITLTWGVPENRVDGSVLVEGNISHYVVVYQREQDAIEEVIIRDASLTKLTMSNLEDGNYQFKIRVIDNIGLASDFSEGVKIILPRSTGF